jgi:DAPG hydrolase PhiG domain
MLASVICGGKVAIDDYLARSHKILSELVIDEPNVKLVGSESFMDINNAYMMLEHGTQPLEHGYYRQSDGCWYIACLTDLGTDCTGEMFDWWFRNCSDTERFKWWHPRDHKSGNWDPQFFAVQPEDRSTGYYVHHSHKTSEVIAGKLQTFQIEYDRPSKYFDITKFPEAGLTRTITCNALLLINVTLCIPYHYEHPPNFLHASLCSCHCLHRRQGSPYQQSRFEWHCTRDPHGSSRQRPIRYRKGSTSEDLFLFSTLFLGLFLHVLLTC